ncbi:ABC transporter ATP-binding protein [Uliginosibacterium sediminicola]|uniref:ABC transporter ATP-binding protein n=1 Tax=Uliginosibacterium sediminicola TaxID=2024550 RepID=A0ABU9YWQ8_9RHOO
MNAPVASLPLLHVADLSLEFRTRSGTVFALENIAFSLNKGEMLGIVGESGSGKSVLAYSMLGISDGAARVTAGTAMFGGADLLKASEHELREIRGREVSMIFQSPRTALNPIRKVGHQIEDVLKRHAAVRGVDLRERAIDCLKRVRIPDPARRYDAYPFELSGGMCQRILIALALACQPSLLIADEPTTGLDVTTQAAIMELLSSLAAEQNMASILITHDLALAAQYCDRIAVMHAGHLIECGPAEEVLNAPHHPYTRRLIASTPHTAPSIAAMSPIPGNLPDLRRSDLPPCRYAGRCERFEAACNAAPLPEFAITPHHTVRCWNAE